MTQDNSNPLSGLADAATGLRKVQDHEKTKNRDPTEKSATVPATAAASSAAPKLTAHAGPRPCGEPRGDAKKEKEGDNWVIANHAKAGVIELEDVEQKNLVFVSNCNNVTIMIKKKVKGVIIENCASLVLCVEQPVLSSVDFCNCKKIIFHPMGEVNTLQLDKTDGIDIYTHPASLAIKIMHSLSQNMNINRMNKEEDWVESPIPNAFVAYYNAEGKLKTEVSDLYSSS